MDETGSLASGGMMVDDQSNIVSEEDELQKAIQMSLQALENMPESNPGPLPQQSVPQHLY